MARDKTLQQFLSQHLKISIQEAKTTIALQTILINHRKGQVNDRVKPTDTVVLNNNILQQGLPLYYFKTYKLPGLECTLNTDIPDNLTTLKNFIPGIYPVGRLDKESEGLLLLTNDAQFFNILTSKRIKTEKVYEVQTNRNLDDDFQRHMQAGVEIRGKLTEPCEISRWRDNQFTIHLKQGLNRQIRRMCYKLGYEVTHLKRIKMGPITLEGTEKNTLTPLSVKEITTVFNLTIDL